MDNFDFKPKVILEENDDNIYGTMIVKLMKCHNCKKYMVVKPRRINIYFNNIFNEFGRYNFESQLKTVGWEINYNDIYNEKHYCRNCFKLCKAIFICFLCEQEKSTMLIKESIGNPPDYLCEDCYKTVTANSWNNIICKLNDIHKYDFK